jgi:hypothetical protein
MNKAKASVFEVVWLLLAVVLSAATSASPAIAQDVSLVAASAASAQSPSGQSAAAQEPTKPPPPTPESSKDDKDDVKITARQAEELFHSVDQILDFDDRLACPSNGK